MNTITQQDEQIKYSEALDRSLQFAVGKTTGGISPAAIMLAFFDWYFHVLIHPAKQLELHELQEKGFLHLYNQFIGHLSGDFSGEYSAISPGDKRFIAESWQQFPYSFYYQSFLLIQHWWHTAATNVRGVSHHH